ncbi:MAG TPA: M23 family metallopeptidase [Thermoanaerobaculia bacterium]|jgi:murein DD-endopeptidase MepM/ murein hydrolase activator NlpD|nr:M23 family metallopeptidase [Thermoanaerobaculia bacterium]
MAKEKKGLPVPLAGLAGFALGAATVLLIVWLYGGGQVNAPTAPVPQAAPAAPPIYPAPAPAPQTPPVAAAPPATAPPPLLARPPADLVERDLLVPVQGIPRTGLLDTYDDARGQGRVHNAIDIMATRGTPVLATEAGRIAKLFTSNLGGLTIYQYDPTETYCYYYAHLDRYAPGLKEGDPVSRGQVIGYVGSTGDASPEGPHLHFEITRLHADKKWWQGDAINPYPILRRR